MRGFKDASDAETSEKLESDRLPDEISGEAEAEKLPDEVKDKKDGNNQEAKNTSDGGKQEVQKEPETVKNDSKEQEYRDDNGVKYREGDNPEDDIEKVLRDYFRDLKEKSECSETIPDKPFDVSDLKKRTPEDNAEKREEFSDMKAQLKKEWEEANGKPWPKYEHDVYSANGKLIRKAGSDYDAHHIQPLGMGGENVASNITPLNAEVHYDKQGVHAPDSPYSKLDKLLGGMD